MKQKGIIGKTRFEMAVVDKVTEIRKEKNYSQSAIADVLDLSRGFIGQVESPNNPSTYSLTHLNRLAYEFKCSLHDFFPKNAIKEWE